jgi:HAE1 family hydrophobic/amphiphilic exporter-1
MTLSLVAVFIPVLFMGGIVGRLLHEFAITITAAILISGFVSISLTPMLCSRFLHPPRDQRHGRLYWLFERVFDSWRGLYSRTLRVSLRYRFITATVSVCLMVATVYLFIQVPKGFLPSEDQGRFNVNTEGAQGISFDEMVRHQLQVADVLLQDPNIASAGVNVGQMGNNATGGSNQGRMFVELKPREQRDVTVDQVIASLRPKLA